MNWCEGGDRGWFSYRSVGSRWHSVFFVRRWRADKRIEVEDDAGLTPELHDKSVYIYEIDSRAQVHEMEAARGVELGDTLGNLNLE